MSTVINITGGGKLPKQVKPIVTHNGSQSGWVLIEGAPWNLSLITPQKTILITYPWLNIDIKYEYFLTEYALSSIAYDTYLFQPPSQIDIDVPELLEFYTPFFGLGYTLNITSKYIGYLSQSQAAIYNAPNCIGIMGLNFFNSNNPFQLNFPKLVWCQDLLSVDGALQYFNFPLLECVGGIQLPYTNFGSNPILNLPSLKYCLGFIYLEGTSFLTQINVPQLKIIEQYIYINNASNLTTFNIGNLLHFCTDYNQRRVEVYNTPLNQASVNQILISLDGTGQYNGTINLAGQCAQPSGAGITAKNNLISKSWNVITN